MAIPFNKFINITSTVGGAPLVNRREFIGRLFDVNDLIPTGSFLEFTDLAYVGSYFGTQSEEYSRARQYFTWISKSNVRATKISFYRWVDADVAPMIFGRKLTTNLATFQAISNGSITIQLGGVTHLISALDFTDALSLSDVAAVLEAGINAQTGTQWTAATVAYNSTSGGFDFLGGDAVVANVVVTAGTTGTNLYPLIGWDTAAIFSNGALTQTITEVLDQSINQSNNFGSFLFMPELDLAQYVEASSWNAALPNLSFQFYLAVDIADYVSYSAALLPYKLTGVTIKGAAGEYHEQDPMQIMAATNYDNTNSVQNYMFQQFPGQTASVTDGTTASSLDAARINYYGNTQQAGQLINFYMRGVLMGDSTIDPVDMNVAANEAWFVDAAGSSLMQLLLGVNRVPVNPQGRAQIMVTLQTVIDEALNNGTISVGKPLTKDQITYITGITGNNDAWYQVQSSGYYLDVSFASYITTDNRTEYEAVYILVYSKDDSIRKIDGAQNLI